jgi:hypothetical protein
MVGKYRNKCNITLMVGKYRKEGKYLTNGKEIQEQK